MDAFYGQLDCNEIICESESDRSPQIDLCCIGFNQFRKTGKFVDLTLILPNKSEFKVHKSIMGLRCPYFKAMFDYNELSRKTEIVNSQQENINNCDDADYHDTNGNDENIFEEDIVKLDREISAHILQKIIDFICYLVRSAFLVSNILLDGLSPKPEVVNCDNDDDNHDTTNENIFEDDIVKLDREISADIFEQIIDYIYTGDIKLSPETALILHENAIFFNLSRLKEICAAFLIKTFQIETCLACWRKSAFDDNLEKKCFEFIVRNCELFLERNILTLTFEQLKKIVSCNKAVCPEGRLYGFVIQWVTNDYEHRSEQFKLLLEDLRFIALTKNDCLKFNIIFNDNISNKELVMTVFDNFKQNGNIITTKTKTNLIYQLTPPRIGFREKHFVAVTPKSIYNHELKTWSLINKHHFNAGFNVNTFGLNYLLFSGGGDGKASKNCEFYCPILNTFKPFPSMSYKRNMHKVLSLNNKIYACGGKFSYTMEIFDLNSGIWVEGPSTIENRADFGMTSDDNCLYVAGSSIVERFDPRQNKWNNISDAPEIFNKTRAVYLNRKLYCFTLNGIHILDLHLNKWLPKIVLPVLSTIRLPQIGLPELSTRTLTQNGQTLELSIRKLPQIEFPELSNSTGLSNSTRRLKDFDVTSNDNEIYVFGTHDSKNCNVYKYDFDSNGLTELRNFGFKPDEDCEAIHSVSLH